MMNRRVVTGGRLASWMTHWGRVLVAAFFLAEFVPIPSVAQSQWKTALVVPGANVVANGKADFEDCFDNIYGSWQGCDGSKGSEALEWSYVQSRVQRTIDLDLDEPGYLYVLFTNSVDKDWPYDEGTIGISKLNGKGEWEGVWLGFSLRRASYRGGKLVDTGPIADQPGIPPLRYRLTADRKVQFWDSIPRYEAGRYRITLTQAYFNNSNTSERQYHPCTLTYKVIFVPDRPVAAGGTSTPPEVTGGQSGSSDPQLICPSTKEEAYRLYTSNFEKLKKLMDQGRGDAPQAQIYYKKYKFYRDCYNDHYSGPGGDKTSGTGSGSAPPANAAYVWALNSAHLIYYWNGSGWSHVEGRATDVGVGARGTVWTVGDTKTDGGFKIHHWTGTDLEDIPGGAVRIDVKPSGVPWVVNSAGDIYRLVHNKWEQIPGGATDIGIGANGAVFVTGTDDVPGGHGIYKWNGSGWKRYPGGGVRIDVDGQGRPWVVDDAGQIFHWKDSHWMKVPGSATDITASPEGAWCTGTEETQGGYSIYRWDPSSHSWLQVPGGGVAISIGFPPKLHGSPGGSPKRGK